MTKKDIKFIKDTLSIIIGQPLRYLGRAGAMVILNFGELIESKDIYLGNEKGKLVLDESGNAVPKRELEGRYGIDILCGMRFICGDEIIFAKSDMYLPSEEIANREDFIWDTFKWHKHGNNFFDEIVPKHFFNNSFADYIVKDIKVNKFGDLTIIFENGFALEFFNDGSGYSEAWRFGEINSSKSLIINGNGIDKEYGVFQ